MDLKTIEVGANGVYKKTTKTQREIMIFVETNGKEFLALGDLKSTFDWESGDPEAQNY